jgi:hypothetical protein
MKNLDKVSNYISSKQPVFLYVQAHKLEYEEISYIIVENGRFR